MKPLLLLAALLLFLGAGCTSEQAIQPAMLTIAPHHTSLETGYSPLSFNLYDTHGNELTDADLAVVHEKLVHLIVVRDDMQGFYHLHPEYVGGMWTVATEIAESGKYRVYADFTPKDGKATVARSSLTVGGVPEEIAPPTDKVDVTLITAPTPTARQETTLSFTLQQDGAAIMNIEPYLGAYGHVVGLRQDKEDVYLHIHPLTETLPSNGIVEFATTFPDTGTYNLFAQFQIDGEVRTFPFTIEVVGTSSAELMDHSQHH